MLKLFDTITVNNEYGIYLLKINELHYVGSSSNLKIRLNQHKNDFINNKHPNLRMQNIFNKYGQEKCFFSILKSYKKISRKKLLQEEKNWIDLIGPTLNIKLDPTTEFNAISTSKTVYQFDLNGKSIKSYPSTKEAERITKIKSSSIVRVCGGYLKSAGGYLWSYSKRLSNRYDLERSKWKWKSVIMKNIETNEEYKFKNIASAARFICKETDNFNSICASISSICNNKGKFIKKIYTFKYEG